MFRNLALMVLSFVLSLAGLEIGYRAFLYYTQPKRFAQSATAEMFVFMSPSPSVFHARYGFDYPPDTSFISGAISDGKLAGCYEQRTNALGGWGRGSNYTKAQIKIAVVGDSFTATAPGGVTWTDELERILAERTGKTVSVRNLARDGQGVLQMLDIAAGEVPTLKPDLLILAYVTDDLTRKRIWRREMMVDGRLRVLQSSSPDFHREHSIDMLVIYPTALTWDWCNATKGKSDAITAELQARYVAAVSYARTRADLFSPASFALQAAMHRGNAFPAVRERTALTNPRHHLSRFQDDPNAAAAIQAIRDAQVPMVTFHMATRGEMKIGQEYAFAVDGPQEYSLVTSLTESIGTPPILTRDIAPTPERLDEIGQPNDDHPSRYGVTFYAETAAQALIQRGLLPH